MPYTVCIVCKLFWHCDLDHQLGAFWHQKVLCYINSDIFKCFLRGKAINL